MLSGQAKEYRKLSQFENLQEFNASNRRFLADHKDKFTKGELIAFKKLTQYSAKYFGIAFAKIATMLKAIHEKFNGYGISRSTFERMLRKAKKLGIIEVIHTIHKKGGQGHSVYVFKRYTNEVPAERILKYPAEPQSPCESKAEAQNSQPETNDKKANINKNNNNIYSKVVKKAKEIILGKEMVSKDIPKEFVDLVSCYFDDAKLIHKLWAMVKKFKKKHYLCPDVLECALEAFKATMRKFKSALRVDKPFNLEGYFHNTVDALMEKEHILEVYSYEEEEEPVFQVNVRVPLYNFLEG